MLVNSIFNFPTHMVLTTPELLEIDGLPLVTPFEKPTRLESLRYYRRVVDTYGIQASFHREVTDIARQGDVFVVTTARSRPDRAAPTGRRIVPPGAHALSCSRSGITTSRILLVSPANSCRMCRITTRSPIRHTASAS